MSSHLFFSSSHLRRSDGRYYRPSMRIIIDLKCWEDLYFFIQRVSSIYASATTVKLRLRFEMYPFNHLGMHRRSPHCCTHHRYCCPQNPHHTTVTCATGAFLLNSFRSCAHRNTTLINWFCYVKSRRKRERVKVWFLYIQLRNELRSRLVRFWSKFNEL